MQTSRGSIGSSNESNAALASSRKTNNANPKLKKKKSTEKGNKGTMNVKNTKKKQARTPEKTRSMSGNKIDFSTSSIGDSRLPSASQMNSADVPPGFKMDLPELDEHHQRLLRHRTLFAFRSFVGKSVTVEVNTGSEYTGILDCIVPDDFSIVLKNTQCVRSGDSDEVFIPGKTIIVTHRELVHIAANAIVNYNEAAFIVHSNQQQGTTSISTDTEISGKRSEGLVGRELQAASSWLEPSLATGDLEDDWTGMTPSGKSNSRSRSSSKSGAFGSNSSWNQFEANEKLFGVVSTYDENLYTTKLDKSKLTSKHVKDAERLAKEIERQSAGGNFHLQEERGQMDFTSNKEDSMMDEEARYSSVDRRNSGTTQNTSTIVRSANAYIPPALRGKIATSSISPSSAKTQTRSIAQKDTPKLPMNGEKQTLNMSTVTPKALSFSDAVRGGQAKANTSAAPKASTVDKKSTEGKKASTSPVKLNKKESLKDENRGKEDDGEVKPEAKKEEKSLKVPSPKHNSNEKKDSSEETKAPSNQNTKDEDKPSSDTKSATLVKKGLNPDAKEFKLSAKATEFTPKYAIPSSAPAKGDSTETRGYHGGYNHADGMAGYNGNHMYPHYSPHLPYGGTPQDYINDNHNGYGMVHDEWMYNEHGMPIDDQSGGHHPPVNPYIGYGGAGMPSQMMPGMYPPVMMGMAPSRSISNMHNAGNTGGHNPRLNNNRHNYTGYTAHHPQNYNVRNVYYPQGGMPYAGGGSSYPPQPPLPREPTPVDPVTPEKPMSTTDPAPRPTSPSPSAACAEKMDKTSPQEPSPNSNIQSTEVSQVASAVKSNG